MPVSRKIRSSIERASWVRRMFEEGAVRKEKYGPENVFDFSLGNPNLEPPAKFTQILKKLASDTLPGTHKYMPNAGYIETRKAVADYLGKLNHISFKPQDIVMTVGAGGGLNVVLKTILNPGDEVIIPAPYFVEYDFYIDNAGGIPKTVRTRPDFDLDVSAIEKEIKPNTKAVLINNPNNPTGRLYSPERLVRLGALLTQYSQRYGEPIYLISDEPYSKIVFDGLVCPSVFAAYRDTFLVTSFSKDLSLAGERIGYIAVHPHIDDKEMLVDGLVLSNRILGFVNAPALMQRIIPYLLDETIDVEQYKKKRDLLCRGLKDAGYTFNIPGGTFYLFPKAPIQDDITFVRSLQEENVLTVPGSGFNGPGYFRIAFCVDDQVIEKAMPCFVRVMKKYK